MIHPYRARVCEQHFLNLPGFHAGAYVRAYVEDTSERDLEALEDGVFYNPEPRIILELADCEHRIQLEFELNSPLDRRNAFFKIETLLEALTRFRDGLAAESD